MTGQTSPGRGPILVYGATGFSGGALADRLLSAGRDIVLGGRDAARVERLARQHGAPFRVFDLGNPAEIDAGLKDISVVIHAAGPFLQTAAPMMEACIRGGVHYLDISGEWPVFALARRLGPAAASVGVMLMPGAGSTIVISDCLAARTARHVPDARVLRVAGSFPGVLSRGTVRSALGLAAGDVIVRRDGKIWRERGAPLARWFNFGAGERRCVAVGGPDVITAQQTTGVADIETYIEAPLAMEIACATGAWLAPAAAGAWTRALSDAAALAWPARPPELLQRGAHVAVVVEAEDRWRRVTRFGVRTLDGYSVTLDTVAAVVERVIAGLHPPGFQTPAGAFGAELIDDLASVWPFDAQSLAPPIPREAR